MELWELEAREAIRTLISRYAHCADTGRFDALVELFAEDGTLEIEGREPLRGRDLIRQFLGATKKARAASTARPLIRHHVTSVDVDVRSREEATASSYFFVITERGPDHWGRYRDQLVHVGGQWRFRQRKVRLDGRRPRDE